MKPSLKNYPNMSIMSAKYSVDDRPAKPEVCLVIVKSTIANGFSSEDQLVISKCIHSLVYYNASVSCDYTAIMLLML